jgi:hypothetical protein
MILAASRKGLRTPEVSLERSLRQSIAISGLFGIGISRFYVKNIDTLAMMI